MTNDQKDIANLENFLTLSPKTIPRLALPPIIMTLKSICAIALATRNTKTEKPHKAKKPAEVPAPKKD